MNIEQLQHHLTEALRYFEGIEPSTFPGLDCGVMEVTAALELVSTPPPPNKDRSNSLPKTTEDFSKNPNLSS